MGPRAAVDVATVEVARKAHALPYPPHWSEELDAASGRRGSPGSRVSLG